MERQTVSVRRSPTYEREAMLEAVRAHFDAFGGVGAFVRPGDRVLLKTNLLMARAPQAATTTHPSLVWAIAAAAREAGGLVCIADSPGGRYTKETLKKCYRISGLEQAAQSAGAWLNFDLGAQQVSFPEGKLCRSFHLISPWHEADVVFSACKLKTHAMTAYTGAVKNCFGLIPGLEKPEMHFRFQQLPAFAQMLIDLCRCAAPRLTFMDAVVGMEGNGPSGGTPRPLGLTLCAENPFALDLFASDLIGFAAHEVETVRLAVQQGLCPERAEQLLAVGEDAAPYRCSFERAASGDVTFSSRIPGPLQKPIKRLLAPRPVVDAARCVGCGECAASCPVQTISISGGKAHIEKKRCIRCFCCQEMCPVKAIDIRKFRGFQI